METFSPNFDDEKGPCHVLLVMRYYHLLGSQDINIPGVSLVHIHIVVFKRIVAKDTKLGVGLWRLIPNIFKKFFHKIISLKF